MKQAIKNTLFTVFDGIDLHGFQFYFGQAIIKKLKSVGLQSDYLNMPAIKKWGKKYVALCTLPAHYIPEEFQKLKGKTAAYPKSFVKKKMLKFGAYFTKYWMKKSSKVHNFWFRSSHHQYHSIPTFPNTKVHVNSSEFVVIPRGIDQQCHPTY